MDPISSVVNRVKEVARSMGKKISDDEGFIRQGQFTPVQAVRDYFNPTSNQGQNLWSTPVAHKLGEIQQSLEQRTLPTVNLTQYATGIKEPVPRFGAELGLGFAENILNIPQRLLYGGARAGQDIRTVLGGGKISSERAIGTAAEVALPLLDIYTLGGGTLVKGLGKQAIGQAAKEGLKSTIKRTAIEGGLLGAGYGALSGAAEGNEAKLGNVLKNATVGGLLGGAIGGITGGVGGILGLIKRSPQVEKELIQRARTQPRDPNTGRWTYEKLVKPKGMPRAQWEYQLKFNKKYGRNPYTPVYPSDLEKAYKYELSKKQIGLSIRDVNKDVSPFEEPMEKAVGKIKIKGGIEPQTTAEGSQTGGGTLPKIGENISQFTETVKTSPKTPKKIRDVVENAYYRPTTNVQDIANAQNTLSVLGWDKAKEKLLKEPLTSENSMLGQIMASRAFKEGKFDEGNEIIKNLSLKATKSGQSIQALSVWSKFTPEGMVKFAQKEIENANNSMPLLNKILGKKGEWTAEDSKFITEQMKKINTLTNEAQKAEATREVFDYISKKLPWGASDLIDEFRYNNMLSNPLTHLRNAINNLQQTFLVRPSTLAAEGKPIEAVKYEIGALKSLPDAFDAFKQALKGKETFGKMDVAEIGSQLQKPKRLGAYNLPSNAMEAADKFFSTLIIGGEKARGKSAEEALKSAEYSLFRQDLKPEQQGVLLNKVDDITRAVYQLRKVGLGWFIPFIRTPMNVAKQWIEYSPAGFATTIGAANKREQVAKALLGTLATAIGADLALQDRVTWAAPTDPLQKKLFYDSGRKPYSIKVGDKWIPMQNAGVFAWALGIPAAVKYYTQESREALSDDQITKLAKIMTSIAGFWSNQTFVSGLASFVKMAEGDIDYNLPKNIGYTLGQLKPMEGLMRYVATVIDSVFRKPRTIGEQLISDIPFLTKQLPAYETTLGEPATRNITNYIMPYAWGFENKQFEEPYQQRTKQLQENALINKTKSEMEWGSKQVGNKLLITTQDGNVKVLDLSKIMPSDTDSNYQKAIKQKKAFSYVDDILDSNMSIDEKGQALAKLGIDPEDAAYYNVARQDNGIKDIYVRDEIAKYGDNRQEMLLGLLKLRREVNGEMILSDKVITSLYDDGIISYDETKWLKNAKYTKDGQVKVKLSGRGKSAKLKSITYRAKKLSYKVPKLKAIKVGGKGIPGRGRIFKTRKVTFK